MYQLEIDQANSRATLVFGGSMTITDAQEIKESLQNALTVTNNLYLDLSLVQEYDLSFMQLLLALYKSSSTSGKKITFIGNESTLFKSFLKDCGCPEYSWLVKETQGATLEESK